MPIYPDDPAVAHRIVAQYREAENVLRAALTEAVKKGTATDDQFEQFYEAQRLRRQAQRIAAALDAQIEEESQEAHDKAEKRAQRQADREARIARRRSRLLREGKLRYDYGHPRGIRDGPGTPPPLRPGTGPATGTGGDPARSLVDRMKPAHRAATRTVDDIYKRVIAEAAEGSVSGLRTRLQAAQDALDRFARRGITGFVDRAGRHWDLKTYAEMSVRTSTARSAVWAGVDRLQEAGIDLVYVSEHSGACDLCGPWSGKILTLSGPAQPSTVTVTSSLSEATMPVDVAGSLDAAMQNGLFHPNCFPAETLVSAPSGVRASDSRWYEGDLVVVHTAGGDQLSVTPNHPVLTPEGWLAAGSLQVGQDILRHVEQVDPVGEVGPGDVQVPTGIGEVHDALREASPVPPVRVPAAAEQFHGDGGETEVEVVLADSFLRDGFLPGLGEQEGEGKLLGRRSGLVILPGPGALAERLLGVPPAAAAVVGGGDLRGPFGCAHALPLAPLGGAAVGSDTAAQEHGADGGLGLPHGLGNLVLRDAFGVHPDRPGHPRLVRNGPGVAGLGDGAQLPEGAESLVEVGGADADGGRDLARRLAGSVAPDHVVHVERRHFAGHVYNLQTGDGWYVAEGIVVHNCRHSISAYLPGATTLPAKPPGDRATQYAQTQRLRELERRVRRAKELEQLALTDAAKAKARRRIRAAQADIRAHTKTTGVPRQRVREQITRAR